MYGTPQSQYQVQAVETAPPAQLVLMMYDGALAAITRAEQAMAPAAADVPGVTEVAHGELVRAQRIIEELLYSLDHERGGQIAANLAALYDFCLDRLMTANIHKDVSVLPAVRDTLAGLREAWERSCCLAAVPA
jgi:flagellar secretion chaperone FliS